MPHSSEDGSDSERTGARASRLLLAGLAIGALAADQLSKYYVEHRTQPGLSLIHI